MNIVVSDPKTKKAYLKKIDSTTIFAGKKIGEEVEMGVLGLDGYVCEITGGSDKQGFPMRKDLEGTNRKKIYIIADKKQGKRVKVSKRGNTVSDEIVQINLKVVKEGKTKLAQLLGGEEAAPKEEELSAKEKAVKASLESVGTAPPIDPKDMKKGKKG